MASPSFTNVAASGRPVAAQDGHATRSERVRLVAPVGRDADVLSQAIFAGGFYIDVHADLHELANRFEQDGGAVLVLTSEAVRAEQEPLQRLIEEQQPWSDVPVLVLSRPDEATADLLAQLDALRGRRSVTVLQRPLQTAALLSAVRSSLHARMRQYEVRDLMTRLLESNQRLEERVEARTQEVRQLAAALTRAEQQERRRIANLLHDDLQQMLFALEFRLQFARRSLSNSLGDATNHNGQDGHSEGHAPPPSTGALHVEQALEHLDEAEKMTGQAIDMARTLTVELSPPILKSDGLEVVFEWLAAHMEEQHGLHVEVEGTCHVEDRDLRVLFFQLGRELLFNVVKHAGTDTAHVALHRHDGHAVIHVRDDGDGFDPSAVLSTNGHEHDGGFGLHAVRERLRFLGGTFEIESQPDAGTKASIVVPVSGDGVDAHVASASNAHRRS